MGSWGGRFEGGKNRYFDAEDNIYSADNGEAEGRKQFHRDAVPAAGTMENGPQPKKIHMPDHLKHRLKEHQIQTVPTPKPPFPAGERISKTASRPEWTGAQRAMKKQIMNLLSF